MKVVDKKPVPIYETTCPECKSRIEYKASEVHFTGYITCPVCGISTWASVIKPVRYEGDCGAKMDGEEWKKGEWIDCSVRLPDHCGYYFVTWKDERPFIYSPYSTILEYNPNKGGWIIDIPLTVGKVRVLKWLLLPEGHKDKNECTY